MTTETNQTNDSNQTDDNTGDNQTPEISNTERTALAAGWVSKDEWIAQGKNPDDWRTAREFVERGELFDQIHQLQETHKKQSAAFKVLVDHHRKVRETAIAEAIQKLKHDKRIALENHDVERVFAIDDEMDKVREQSKQEPVIDIPVESQGPSPTFKSWHKRNDWYQIEGDDEVSRMADVIGQQWRTKNPTASESEFLEYVESRIAKRFPEVFENPNAKRGSEVNPRSNGKANAETNFKLNDEQERVCKMFVDQGIMTRKQYIEELRKLS